MYFYIHELVSLHMKPLRQLMLINTHVHVAVYFNFKTIPKMFLLAVLLWSCTAQAYALKGCTTIQVLPFQHAYSGTLELVYCILLI